MNVNDFILCCGGKILYGFPYTRLVNEGPTNGWPSKKQVGAWLEKKKEEYKISQAFLVATLTDRQVPELHDIFTKAGFLAVGRGMNRGYGQSGKDITVYLWTNERTKDDVAPISPPVQLTHQGANSETKIKRPIKYAKKTVRKIRAFGGE